MRVYGLEKIRDVRVVDNIFKKSQLIHRRQADERDMRGIEWKVG